MARISIDISDEILQKISDSGQDPASVFQERFYGPPTIQASEPMIAERFRMLADQWKRETKHHSLMNDIVLNAAYQQVIGMGMPVVPFLLEELKQQPDHWFWALRSITGENPISPSDRGRLSAMSEAWIQWGRDRGYQC